MKKRTRVFAVACAAALLCIWSGCSSEEGLLPTGSSPVPPRPTLPPLPPLPVPPPASSGTSHQKSKAPGRDADGERKKDRKKKDQSDSSDAGRDRPKGDETSSDKRASRITNEASKDGKSGSFAAEIDIDRENSKIEIKAVLVRPKASDGVDPSAEEVALDVGSFSLTIPAGSFKLTETTPVSQFRFEGDVDGVNLEMSIRIFDELVWFDAEAEPAELPVSSSPLVVAFRIGDDTATTTATADIR